MAAVAAGPEGTSEGIAAEAAGVRGAELEVSLAAEREAAVGSVVLDSTTRGADEATGASGRTEGVLGTIGASPDTVGAFSKLEDSEEAVVETTVDFSAC